MCIVVGVCIYIIALHSVAGLKKVSFISRLSQVAILGIQYVTIKLTLWHSIKVEVKTSLFLNNHECHSQWLFQ